jgi:hypothetical protein
VLCIEWFHKFFVRERTAGITVKTPGFSYFLNDETVEKGVTINKLQLIQFLNMKFNLHQTGEEMFLLQN